MRQSPEQPLVKQTHYRVLCLGESTTADMEYMGRESYPAQLESILNERADGVSFTVVNGGMPATTTDAILKELPKNLDLHHPDIVVAMMGVNDGEAIDPLFQVSGGLRVWKLAKVIYYTWWNPHAFIEGGGLEPPIEVSMSSKKAWIRVIEGRFAEAEAILLPMLNQDEWPISRLQAHGIMAVLSWQRGDEQEAERFHQRFLELERLIPNSRTVRNYRELRRILGERKIPLVAVQYPSMPVDTLKQMLDPEPGTVFVDNEQTFLQAIKTQPVREIYRDLVAGLFGHMTPYANGLLAANVARGVLELVADHRVELSTPMRRNE